MSDRIVRLIVGGVLAIVTALGVFWFLKNFELAEREVTDGYSQEARRNPFLAAERFLGKLGVKTGTLASTDLWRNLPDTKDVLVLYRYMPPAGELRRRSLREWVESGGHLIVGADDNMVVDADEVLMPDLLGKLGVRVRAVEMLEAMKNGTRVELDFEAVEKPVAVTMSPRRYLEDDSDEAVVGISMGKGYAVLQYEVGKGRVTVFADNAFLTNRHIGKEDNALALALLVDTDQQGKVWFVTDVVMPSLLELAWRNASYAIMALIAVIVLWLWKLGAHLGPLLPPEQSARRDIGEHLAASAQYFWRLDGCRQLFHDNRQRIGQAWLGKHYVLKAMTPAQRCEWIAARSGLTPRAVERALFGDYAKDSDFVELSSYLQVLRSTL